ncbi:MAG: ribose-phosphate diphosphokinase [Bacillota bacterium]|nr:ribose-phosphate diphosphokinase [Bacillota bacterium]
MIHDPIRPASQSSAAYSDYTHYNLQNAEPVAPLGLVALPGSRSFVELVDQHLGERRRAWFERSDSLIRLDSGELRETYILDADAIRFATGEGKGQFNVSVRGHDLFIFCDVMNHSVTYTMWGQQVSMSPDEHFQDLVRLILAATGKAKRINVIMPFLYESRQDVRQSRESLDCAYMLKELAMLGVDNIITFDPHDPRIENALPRQSVENIPVSYRLIQSLLITYPDIRLKGKKSLMVVSPDESGMKRSMFYATILELPFGTFYRQRKHARASADNNEVVDYKFLGDEPGGRDVLIVDDMINTGASVVETSERLKRMGARRVFCLCTFPLFVEGIGLIDEAVRRGYIDRVFCTNLIYRRPELLAAPWYTDVDVSSFVTLLVDAINYNLSIAKLIDQKETIREIIGLHQQAQNMLDLASRHD